MAFGSRQKSISSKGGPMGLACGQLVIGGMFLVMGGVFFVAFGLLPLFEWIRTSEFKPELIPGLFGLVFAAVGGAVILSALVGRGRARRIPPAQAGTLPVASPMAELRPSVTKRVQLIFVLIFTLGWNGFISVFLYFMFSEPEKLSTAPLLAMSPFVAVGVGLIAFTVYCLLALFNPQPHLRLTPGAIPLGATGDLDWTIIGSVDRIAKLTIWLEGQEEAKYRQGTRTVTVNSVFEKIPLLETTNIPEMRVGKAPVALPEFTMHSFEAPNNKIKWLLKVHGVVPRWPDISLEFPITVLPLPPVQG